MAAGDRSPAGPWRARLETIEAMAGLVVARVLVSAVRLSRWRRLLGQPGTMGPQPETAPRIAHHLARVVDRAVMRLPAEARCLPQAMALAWMLRRRGFAPVIVVAVLPGRARGSIDDLHAWVELSGEILIGETDMPHKPLAKFG